MAVVSSGLALPEKRHTFLNTPRPPEVLGYGRIARACAGRPVLRALLLSLSRSRRGTLAARAALSLAQAGAVAAPRLFRVALLLIGSAQDEPGLSVGRVERDRALPRFDRSRHFPTLERGLGCRFLLPGLPGLRRLLGIGQRARRGDRRGHRC